MSRRSRRRGAALLVSLFTLMVVMLLSAAVIQSLLAARRQARVGEIQLQSEWLAEAAASRAIARLTTDPDYAGETWRIAIGEPGEDETIGVAEICVENDAQHAGCKRVVVSARYPDNPIRQVATRREYTIRTEY